MLNIPYISQLSSCGDNHANDKSDNEYKYAFDAKYIQLIINLLAKHYSIKTNIRICDFNLIDDNMPEHSEDEILTAKDLIFELLQHDTICEILQNTQMIKHEIIDGYNIKNPYYTVTNITNLIKKLTKNKQTFVIPKLLYDIMYELLCVYDSCPEIQTTLTNALKTMQQKLWNNKSLENILLSQLQYFRKDKHKTNYVYYSMRKKLYNSFVYCSIYKSHIFDLDQAIKGIKSLLSNDQYEGFFYNSVAGYFCIPDDIIKLLEQEGVTLCDKLILCKPRNNYAYFYTRCNMNQILQYLESNGNNQDHTQQTINYKNHETQKQIANMIYSDMMRSLNIFYTDNRNAICLGYSEFVHNTLPNFLDSIIDAISV